MLDARLKSAAKFVRQGAVFADIGTDHAYLPLFLLENRIIEKAVLSDINEGPLSRARENVLTSGYGPQVTFRLTDGAAGLDGEGITDYAVCGMGGELIERIIANAPHMRKEGVRLILQPMSKAAHLRRALWDMGISILGEDYSFSEGKYYVCILAEYSGKTSEYSEIEAELGEKALTDTLTGESRAAYRGYLLTRLSSLRRAIEGKSRGSADCTDEISKCEEIKRRLTTLENDER